MPDWGKLLPEAPATRRGIPLYYQKSERENREDVYERYDQLVVRQTILHLADEIHGGYPLQKLFDYLADWLPDAKALTVADVGCSVGRIIGEVAHRHTSWDCYGIDFSYQMLRQAREYWMLGESLSIDASRSGFGYLNLHGRSTPNLCFALASANALPFPANSLDLLINTFLLDRLTDPLQAFGEWWRVLKSGGRVITVTPLNFLQREQWQQLTPPIVWLDRLRTAGWQLIDLTDPLWLEEPIDRRGNTMRWNTLAVVLEKPL